MTRKQYDSTLPAREGVSILVTNVEKTKVALIKERPGWLRGTEGAIIWHPVKGAVEAEHSHKSAAAVEIQEEVYSVHFWWSTD